MADYSKLFANGVNLDDDDYDNDREEEEEGEETTTTEEDEDQEKDQQDRDIDSEDNGSISMNSDDDGDSDGDDESVVEAIPIPPPQPPPHTSRPTSKLALSSSSTTTIKPTSEQQQGPRKKLSIKLTLRKKNKPNEGIDDDKDGGDFSSKNGNQSEEMKKIQSRNTKESTSKNTIADSQSSSSSSSSISSSSTSSSSKSSSTSNSSCKNVSLSPTIAATPSSSTSKEFSNISSSNIEEMQQSQSRTKHSTTILRQKVRKPILPTKASRNQNNVNNNHHQHHSDLDSPNNNKTSVLVSAFTPISNDNVHNENRVKNNEANSNMKETNTTTTSPQSSSSTTRVTPKQQYRPSHATPSMSSEKRILLHSGPAPSLPKGWTVKHYKRTTGKKHTDRYWFSPLLKKKFRSLAQVQRFLALLQFSEVDGSSGNNNGNANSKGYGDEAKAWELFKTSTSGPDEVRSDQMLSGGGSPKNESKRVAVASTPPLKSSHGNTTTTSTATSTIERKKSSTTSHSHNTMNHLNLFSGFPGSNISGFRSLRLPPISSPGLFAIPTPSLLQKREQQQKLIQANRKEAEESGLKNVTSTKNDDITTTPTSAATTNSTTSTLPSTKTSSNSSNNQNIMNLGPLIETTEKGYVTPSTVFNYALFAAGLTFDQSLEKKHVGSSIKRTVDDMFDSNVMLDYKESDFFKMHEIISTETDKNEEVKTDNSNEASDTNGVNGYRVDKETNDPKLLEQPLAKKPRISNVSIMQELNKIHNNLKTKYLNSSSCMQYEDMLPTALTKSYPESYSTELSNYYNKVKYREDALKQYHEQTNANQDAIDKYQDLKVEWELEQVLLKKRELESLTKHTNNTDKESEGETDKTMKDDLSKEDTTSSSKDISTEDSITKSSEEDDVLPMPLPPKLLPVIDLPPVPVPPRLSPEENKTCIEDSKKYLVAHLDPSSFLLTGRYYGLLSNNIADPQFIGPNAPGIVSNSQMSALGVSHSGNSSVLERPNKRIGSSNNVQKNTSSNNSGNSNSKAKSPTSGGKGKKSLSASRLLKNVIESGGEAAEAMRDSILQAAVYISRTGSNGGPFVGSDGITYPDVGKALSSYGNLRPCTRCKSNKQGAYHCRLRRKHQDMDFDGGRSADVLKPLFAIPIEELLVKTKVHN